MGINTRAGSAEHETLRSGWAEICAARGVVHRRHGALLARGVWSGRELAIGSAAFWSRGYDAW